MLTNTFAKEDQTILTAERRNIQPKTSRLECAGILSSLIQEIHPFRSITNDNVKSQTCPDNKILNIFALKSQKTRLYYEEVCLKGGKGSTGTTDTKWQARQCLSLFYNDIFLKFFKFSLLFKSCILVVMWISVTSHSYVGLGWFSCGWVWFSWLLSLTRFSWCELFGCAQLVAGLVFFIIVNYICTNCKNYLSKLQKVFVQIARSICPNCK